MCRLLMQATSQFFFPGARPIKLKKEYRAAGFIA